MDGIEEFKGAMRAHGVTPPEIIEPGKLHRFATNGRASDDAGWCKLFPDCVGGVFGDFRSGLSETWQAEREKPFTSAEREAFWQRCEVERRAREAEGARRHAEAREKAAEILEAATGDPATHPYAIKKQVRFGPLVRRGPWPQRGWTDALLVPIYGGDGRLWSIEAINADGSKDSLKGAPKRGGFHPFGRIRGASRVLIAEGLANAAVGSSVDGSPAAAAMGKSNLLHAALAARKLAPEAAIIILADNDLSVPKEAQDAARAVGGRVAVPDLGGRKCDFWDLWQKRGPEAVRRAIADAKAPAEDQPRPGNGASAGGSCGGHKDVKANVAAVAEVIEDAIEKLATDIGAIFEPEVITALKSVRASKPADYQRYRKRIKDAGAPVAELDRLVCVPDSKGGDAQQAPVLFPDIKPWAEPVDGAVLLTDLVGTVRRYVILTEHGARAIALWIVFTHCIDAVSIAPILAITSPEKRCGKSTVLALLKSLVLRRLPCSNISAASLFRAVEAWAPTLLIDEADTFLKDSDDLRGILNSGHTRDLAFVIRTVGDDHEPRKFSTWGAKAIALIGGLKDTLADRSIEVALKRKLPGEHVERLRHADPEGLDILARRCARWAMDHAEEIRAARPSMPKGLHDRAEDNWEPLLAIADLAGGEWPELARKAAMAMSGDVAVENDNIRVQLLSDIRDVLKGGDFKGSDRISGEHLTTRLIALEERPWSEYSRGKPLTKNKLARMLRLFKVVSGSVRLPDGTTPKGYLFEQLTDAFERYLPPLDTPSPGDPCSKAQQRHKQGGARVSDDFESATADRRGVSENGPEPSCGAACGGVAFSDPPPWKTRI